MSIYDSLAKTAKGRVRTLGKIVVGGKTYLDVDNAASLVGVSSYTIRNYDYNGLIVDSETILRDRVKYYLDTAVKRAHNESRNRKERSKEQRIESVVKSINRACRLMIQVLDADSVADNDKVVIKAFLVKHQNETRKALEK